MKKRTETATTYRIADLAAPRLPAAARAFNRIPAALAARLLPLDAEKLVRAARRRTGLADFGGEDFREPLALMLEDLRGDERITPLGRVTVRAVLTQVLETRLLLRHAERAGRGRDLAPVRAPLVIVGLPRSGTTHLHNLLSRVPALQFLPLWRSIVPFRPPGWRGVLPDLRRVHTAARLRAIDFLMPRLRAMHEMEVDEPHEELQLCAPALRSFFFEASFDVPRYRAWYAGRQHYDAYAYLRRALQLLDGGGGKRRWVLKSPQHLDQLPALTAAFPDAVILRTRRDPVDAALSLITMILYSRRAIYRRVDVRREARAWFERLARMLADARAHAEALPAGRVYDVDFDGFVADPVGTVEEILRFGGVDCDAATREALRDYQANHPRNRYGRVVYEYDSLGLDPEEMRDRFAAAAPPRRTSTHRWKGARRAAGAALGGFSDAGTTA